MFHRATYCMLAPGAQAAADAVDAILLGCVPVLHPRAPVLENEWPWHWQPNDEAALTLSADAWDAENNPEGPVNLVAFTETKRLRGLRGQIALTSHRLLYAAVDTRHIARVLPNFRAPADAFDVIVARVWTRAQQADPELTALAKKPLASEVAEARAAASERETQTTVDRGARGIDYVFFQKKSRARCYRIQNLSPRRLRLQEVLRSSPHRLGALLSCQLFGAELIALLLAPNLVPAR